MVLKDSIELLKEEEEASLQPLTSHPFSAATDEDSYSQLKLQNQNKERNFKTSIKKTE